MGNPYPIEVADADGVARLQGEATFTDPANQPGGGGSQPITREQLTGDTATIGGGGGAANLTWDNSNGPDVLLDISTPAAPTVVVAGTYAVTVSVLGSAVPQGKAFYAYLALDATGEDPVVTSQMVQPANAFDSSFLLALTYYIPAGGVIQVNVQSEDSGVYAIGAAVVQRLS